MNGNADESSVIYQSVIVPKNRLPALHVTTAKKSDFSSLNLALDEFLSDAFRIPRSAVISFEKWAQTARKLESAGVWDDLEHDWIFHPWGPPSDRLWSEWRKEIRRVKSEISHFVEPAFFAKACVRGILAGASYPRPTTRRPQRQPIVHPFLHAEDWVLATVHSYAYLQRDRIEVAPDEVAYWVYATSCLTRPVPRNLEESLTAFLECDMPYSPSPRSESRPLSRFIQEARLVALFPIISVTVPASHYLTQGNWVAAFQVTVAGAGVSLLLASTFSLVDWILNLPTRQK